MTTADRRWAAHLLRRAGFGAGPDELDTYAALGYEGAVNRLLSPNQVDDSDTQNLLADTTSALDPDANIVDGQALWLTRMLYTKRPLQEKMSLFWHNHFATGVQKVKYPPLMYAQNQLFLSKALGKFDDLLSGVAHDPAMIFWLDNNTNVKGHPNENWGREVMELFTIGIGNYTEQDVKENARAFTGWSATQDGNFRFLANRHDTGSKTILGHTGNFNGDDVLKILVNMRQTGTFLGRKMWRWFVNDTPSTDGVNRLADVYMQSGHDITAMLRALFLSDDFRSEANYFATVKNPPEFVVGLLKQTGAAAAMRGSLDPNTLRLIARSVSSMSMMLFNPPNVAGWPGGRSWINPGTYFARTTFAEQLLGLRAGGQPVTDIGRIAGAIGGSDAASRVANTLEWAMPAAPAAPLQQDLTAYLGSGSNPVKTAGLLRLVFSSPSYQLN
ncbi:MAG: DUF1800 domain-containing protein [Chloroflexia bacterium]